MVIEIDQKSERLCSLPQIFLRDFLARVAKPNFQLFLATFSPLSTKQTHHLSQLLRKWEPPPPPLYLWKEGRNALSAWQPLRKRQTGEACAAESVFFLPSYQQRCISSQHLCSQHTLFGNSLRSCRFKKIARKILSEMKINYAFITLLEVF